ncbi:uncharacterized protein MONOS_7735 [Monocercomonoides exilis]|uniref:uncharacterized protein n=1 Tax=Monocercomonoides exilis TaxID=2049356 RepID=UPI0035593FAD|nr:hypothetical protein MONOS_7735 [Monocercomonoides exilis]|eukprot:MONOS_7735.1-p1 / transcript=MONOS_7735.1 / gene=MONOS_7735 / organism=Monocercomonoides_exilis_PA203 / gene_product=unspecified product / transcript_product=unspecified product / location=Mono_scaffold00272:45261-47393(+) / protein_length=655 / sequence_SO=supercontig / SO=protein_coding / is_pseudo=false
MTQSRCVVNPMFSIKGVHWKPLHVLNLSKSLNTATYSLWGTIYTNISSNFYKTEDEIILPTENVQLGYPEHISSKSKIQETEMLFEHSPPSFTKQAVEARQFGHKHFYTPAGRTVTIPLKGSTQVLLLKSGNEGSYSLYGKERPQGSKLYTTSFSSFEDKMPESTVENQTSQNDSTTISFHDKCDQDEEVDQIRVKPILRLNLTSLKHGSKKAETAIAKPNVYIKIKNTLKNLLGKAPLPAGKFLIYHEQEGESLAPKLSKNTYVYNANLTHPVNIGDSFELKIDEAENVVCRWMHIPFSIRKVKTKDLPREIPLRTRLIEMGIDEVIQRDMFVKVSCRRNEGEEKTFLNISPLELMKEEDELKKLKGNLDTDSYQNGNKDNSSQRNSPISGFLSGPKILFNSAKNFLFRFMKSLSKQAKNSKPTFVNTLAKETIYEGENILFEKDTLLEFKHFEKMIEATENKIYGNNDYDTDDDTFGNEIFDEQTINEKMELMALYDNYFKERTKAKQSNISSNQSKVTKSLCSYLNNTQNSLADEVSKFAIKKDRFILSPESKALDSIEIIDKIPSYGTIISIDPTQQLSQREPDGTLKWRLNFNTKRKILSAKPAIVEKIRDYFSPRSYERKTLFYSAASVMYTYSIISEEIEHSLNSKK